MSSGKQVQGYLSEPLTEREREILRLLADGLTNQDIAGRLFLSLGTIKWHNSQIFSKLGVQNRTQAIKRGRELGLLTGSSQPSRDAPAPGPGDDEHAPRPHNLPAQPVPFVGRRRELDEIGRLLYAPECRLLTLVGPGGIGKTCLAVEAATRQLDRYADGAVFLSLAPLSSPADIIPALVQAMRLPIAEGQGLEQQLLAHLSRKALLLVLDNFDELLSGAALVSSLLQAAPGVKALVTSRERLNLQEEIIFRVEGMNVPARESAQEDAGPLLDNDAVQLFAQSARRAQPGFNLDERALQDIARICQLVEGMPLAIVLAASWLSLLSPHEIAEEITQGLDFLSAELRNMPARHRSVRSVFESTWNLLPPDERQAFAELSVFRGGFTREAAQQVAGAGLRVLVSLADKSLLRRDAQGRFHIHELLRQFAVGRLQHMGQLSAVRGAHAGYYLDWLGRCPIGERGHEQSPILEQIEADFENIRAAFHHAIDVNRFDLIEAASRSLYLFCTRRSRYQDAERMFSRAIESAERGPGGLSAGGLPRLREYRGRVRGLLGEFDGAIADLNQARDEASREGDLAWERAVLIGLGQLNRKTGRSEEAARFLSQALAGARAGGDARAVADTLYHIGTLSWDEGDNAQSMAYHQEAVEISRRLDLRDIVAVQAVHGLGEASFMAGRPQFAAQCFSESLETAREIDDLGYVAENLQMIGWSSLGTLGIGDYQRANACLHQSLSLSQNAHLDWHTVCTLTALGLAEGCLGGYGAGLERIRRSLQMAESLGLQRFMVLALDGLGELYLHLNLPEHARSAHERGAQLTLRMESTYWLPRLQANLAINKLRQGDLSVEPELRAALGLALSRSQEMHAVRCLEGLAEFGIVSGKAEQALADADQLAALAERGGMREVLARARRWRGEAMLELGQFDRAEGELSRALAAFTELGTTRQLRDVHLALARLCRSRGHAAAARQHLELANDLLAGIAARVPDVELRLGLAELAAQGD